jgi:flavin-dependent dehydrogenase
MRGRARIRSRRSDGRAAVRPVDDPVGRTPALTDLDADVVIIGAGPAGAAAAIALAGSCRVALLERSATIEDRIGETLPASARPLLEQLGLWDGFREAPHVACRARRCVWGGPEPVDQESPGGEGGFGWQIDRRLFETQLRGRIAGAGIQLLAPVGVTSLARDPRGWSIEVVGRGYDRPLKIRASIVIDAGGRASRTLRPFGQTRLAEDRLVCAWVHAPLLSEPSDVAYLESDPDGWWSSAPLPDGRRVIAFYTDSDLPVTGQLLEGGLVERARLSRGLSETIADAGLSQVTPVRFCAAHGARLDAAAGEGWLAAGDAAICFDPLASNGLLNALHTGREAGMATRRMLNGDDEAEASLDAEIGRLWRSYRLEREAQYRLEQRWPESLFWKRRLA